MSLTILEGIDKVGKSTLAKQFQANGFTLIKVSQPKTSQPFQEYVELISRLSTNRNYVLDRFYLGELAYGQVYRGKSRLSPIQQFYLEQLLFKFNPLLVYCWLDYNELAYNFTKDNEETTKLQDVPKLDRLFRDGFQRSLLPKILYNYNHDKIKTNKCYDSFNLGLSYLGVKNPTVLFIGDEPNYRLHLCRHVPYQVFNSTSGLFLMSCLSWLKDSFGVVNSKEGHWLLSKRDIELINPKEVVCLGLSSLRRISKLGVKLRYVHHPNFAKRFYGKNAISRYVNELRHPRRN